MPKSKKRRKNGTVVSGRKIELTAVEGLGVFFEDAFEDEVLNWALDQNYGDDLSALIDADGPDEEYHAYLDHLREGYRCAQSGEPWTYIPPKES